MTRIREGKTQQRRDTCEWEAAFRISFTVSSSMPKSCHGMPALSNADKPVCQHASTMQLCLNQRPRQSEVIRHP